MNYDTDTLSARLADLYAGEAIENGAVGWDASKLLQEGTPAATFRASHPEHAFAKFLTEFQERYAAAAQGKKPLISQHVADIPFIGAKVLAGEPPVVVISQRSYSTQPGSVSLWAMLFPFERVAPEQYAGKNPEWKSWRSKYPQYQQTLCSDHNDLSLGLDPETLVVTDACLPRGCGDEQAFLNKFIAALPRPRLILSLGGDAAKRLKMEERWRGLRAQQRCGLAINPGETTGSLPTSEPIVVSPFVWGNNAKDRRGPHFAAAVEAVRSILT